MPHHIHILTSTFSRTQSAPLRYPHISKLRCTLKLTFRTQYPRNPDDQFPSLNSILYRKVSLNHVLFSAIYTLHYNKLILHAPTLLINKLREIYTKNSLRSGKNERIMPKFLLYGDFHPIFKGNHRQAVPSN